MKNEIKLWKIRLDFVKWLIINKDDLEKKLKLGPKDFRIGLSIQHLDWVLFNYEYYKNLPKIFDSILNPHYKIIKLHQFPQKEVFQNIKFESYGNSWKQPHEIVSNLTTISLKNKYEEKEYLNKKVSEPLNKIFSFILIFFFGSMGLLALLSILGLIIDSPPTFVDPANVWRL